MNTRVLIVCCDQHREIGRLCFPTDTVIWVSLSGVFFLTVQWRQPVVCHLLGSEGNSLRPLTHCGGTELHTDTPYKFHFHLHNTSIRVEFPALTQAELWLLQRQSTKMWCFFFVFFKFILRSLTLQSLFISVYYWEVSESHLSFYLPSSLWHWHPWWSGFSGGDARLLGLHTRIFQNSFTHFFYSWFFPLKKWMIFHEKKIPVA